MSDVRTEIAEYLRDTVDANLGLPVWALTEIGRGGSHVVYERTPSDPFVLKVPHGYLRPPDPSRMGEPDCQVYLEQKAAELTVDYERLYRYLGLEWCIPQRALLAPIQLSPEADPFPAYVLVQKRESAFARPDLIRIGTPYLELQLDNGSVDGTLYRQMNNALLGMARPEISQYEALNQQVRPCLELIHGDLPFRDLIRTFLLRFRAYVEAADEIMDLVGQYNVFALQECGRWTMRIGSVLKGQRHSDLLSALATLQQVGGRRSALPRQQRFLVLNGVAVYRLINALSIQVGMGRLIDLQLDPDQLEAIRTVRFEEA
jgi:hypothetical protein